MTDRLLLDTHALLWWLADGPLDDGARQRIADAPVVAVSAASVWEIGVKVSIGKLRVEVPFAPVVKRAGFTSLSITGEHADAAAMLPLHHRDPFDRMIIAQARSDQYAIVTRDRRFSDYEVEIVGC